LQPKGGNIDKDAVGCQQKQKNQSVRYILKYDGRPSSHQHSQNARGKYGHLESGDRKITAFTTNAEKNLHETIGKLHYQRKRRILKTQKSNLLDEGQRQLQLGRP
jgi:hypothetical protein